MAITRQERDGHFWKAWSSHYRYVVRRRIKRRVKLSRSRNHVRTCLPWRISCRHHAHGNERAPRASRGCARLSQHLHRSVPRGADRDKRKLVRTPRRCYDRIICKCFQGRGSNEPRFICRTEVYTRTEDLTWQKDSVPGHRKPPTCVDASHTALGTSRRLPGRGHSPAASRLRSQRARSVGGETQRRRFHEVARRDAVL